MSPDYEGAYMGMIQTYCRKKMFEEAIHEVEALEKVSKETLEPKLWRAYVLAAMGSPAEARDLLSEVQVRHQSENISPFRIGEVHFLLGDANAGFEWLEKAYDSHDGNLNMLHVEHVFDGVRNDPRFLDLKRKIGLQ
jgi:penicillin V acylase-like amidase (Ntn superfamily)